MKFKVPDMSCGHCTSTIEKAIKEVDSAASVICNISDHTVAVQSALPPEKLADVLKRAGYDSMPVVA
jgi:copper chaperone